MAYAQALQALGDPTRRSVLEELREGPRAVGEIAAGLPISRPAVSQHLRVLKEAGLVTEREEGTRTSYGVAPEAIAQRPPTSPRTSTAPGNRPSPPSRRRPRARGGRGDQRTDPNRAGSQDPGRELH